MRGQRPPLSQASSSRAYSFGLKRRHPHNRFNLERLDGRQFLDLERRIRIWRSGNRHVETTLTNARHQGCKRPHLVLGDHNVGQVDIDPAIRATPQLRRPSLLSAGCAAPLAQAMMGAAGPSRRLPQSADSDRARCSAGWTRATATPSPRRSPSPPRQPSRPATTIAMRPVPAPGPLAPARSRGTLATDRQRGALRSRDRPQRRSSPRGRQGRSVGP